MHHLTAHVLHPATHNTAMLPPCIQILGYVGIWLIKSGLSITIQIFWPSLCVLKPCFVLFCWDRSAGVYPYGTSSSVMILASAVVHIHSHFCLPTRPRAQFASPPQNATMKIEIAFTFHERVLRTSEDFVWPVDTAFLGRFVIDIEFLDLRTCPVNGETRSVWPSDGKLQTVAAQSTLRCLSHMLDEAIHADLTIITADGTLRAHKAVLSASSTVLHSLYLDNGDEKETSTINMEDMSQESCMALLSYLYGTIKQEDFWKHRLALLGAADKYEIGDLKDACEESLLEDLNSGNVLDRLNDAWLYQLQALKKGCFSYLFYYGKIYDVRDEMDTFFRHADRELMLEMFQEVLTISK
ncbi:BTB/POZ domain-containing protein [Glycine max]|nr:BTB/POZ domain-containing protein [Glycine max]